MSAVDDLVRRLVREEDALIEAALRRAGAAGCGVKVTRRAAVFDPFDGDTYRALSTITVEVCADVPAGEVHVHQQMDTL